MMILTLELYYSVVDDRMLYVQRLPLFAIVHPFFSDLLAISSSRLGIAVRPAHSF